MVYFPWCLEALAGLAAAQGDLERAAELAAARDALREQIGVFLPPVYPAGYERTLPGGPGGPGLGSLRCGARPGQLACRRRRSSRRP